MLYSPRQNLAFAHYPKTAGHSLTIWFQTMFPDARFVEPLPNHPISHLAVRPACERLGVVSSSISCCSKTGSIRMRLKNSLLGLIGSNKSLRIIGVLREPFEMLVSLYEYWRHFDFGNKTDLPSLIQVARTESFYVFIGFATGEYRLEPYEEFFDVDGPVWPSTRLLAFESLDLALRRVLEEFEVPEPILPLGRHNTGPKPGLDLRDYYEAAGDRVSMVHDYYRWYYEQGRYLMVQG